MKNIYVAAFVILLLIGLFAIPFIGIFVYADEIDQAIGRYITSSMHKKTIVAENAQITSEWLEIKPEKPLETTKLVQNVQLLIEGYKSDIQNSDFGDITLTDGRKIKPEIEIVDENGKVYKLKDSHRIGDLIGFSIDEKIHGSHSFPKDIKYKIIRIRSDESFQCKKVIWYDYDLK